MYNDSRDLLSTILKKSKKKKKHHEVILNPIETKSKTHEKV